MTVVGLLIALIVFCLIYWAATRLMSAFGVGDPVYTVVIVALVFLFLIWLIGQFGWGPSIPLTNNA